MSRFFVTFNFSLPAACFLEAKWFLRMLFLELNISLHPLQNSFPPRRHKFSPGNSSIRSRGLMFFGSEFPFSLYFPVLLLRTRSLEIKALGMALEVVKVYVLEDDAIWGAEPPSHKRGGLSLSLMHRQDLAQGNLCGLPDHIWPWALAQTSIFSKYNTEIKYKLNYSRPMMGFFVFNA